MTAIGARSWSGSRCARRFRWHCLTYCLMPNHYHLVVQTPKPESLEGMRQINGIYAQRFNRRHDRCGHLFQGRFGATLVETAGTCSNCPVCRTQPGPGGPCRRRRRLAMERHAEISARHPRLVSIACLLASTRPRTAYREFVASDRGLGSHRNAPIVGRRSSSKHLSCPASGEFPDRPGSQAGRASLGLRRLMTRCGDHPAYREHGYRKKEIAEASAATTRRSRRIRRFEKREASIPQMLDCKT